MNYCFLDIETGGLYPDLNPILSLGAIITDQEFNVKERFYSLINPPDNLKVEEAALRVNGINIKECKTSPTEKEILEKFNALLLENEMPIITGFNLQFDLSFLKSAYFRNKIYLVSDGYTLDLQSTARNIGQLYRYSLKGVCEDLGIVQDKAHNALADATSCLEIAKKILV